MELSILSVCYLIGSITFIVGLRMLSHPDLARKGNLVAATGMSIAILGTLLFYSEDGKHLHNYGWIVGGLIIGGIVGTLAARRVKMTAMPEMVSLFNGMGGLCAALISIVEFQHLFHHNTAHLAFSDYLTQGNLTLHLLVILLCLLIGTVSFAGSLIAYGKLNGFIKNWSFIGQHVINLAVLFAVLVLIVYLLFGDVADPEIIFFIIIGLSVIYGIFFVMPIGGADMPVVISLLNSFTGVATAFGGFMYDNQVMLTGGVLVGSAGSILTIVMCKAMNRSLMNVLIGSFGGGEEAATAVPGKKKHYKEISIGDAAVVLAFAKKVIIVPGYGLAVAQAQHVCHELEVLLENKGVEVKYAIHPVAGRMPGHMNVLMAEAKVEYDKLLEMNEANEEFPFTDVVVVLGANDVVNPAAENDPKSPIYGMEILQVEKAKTVIVNKRSMRPGYAGIENQLFFQPKTSMLFGDAKDVLNHLMTEIKTL